jgi:hypothetical protein
MYRWAQSNKSLTREKAANRAEAKLPREPSYLNKHIRSPPSSPKAAEKVCFRSDQEGIEARLVFNCRGFAVAGVYAGFRGK